MNTKKKASLILAAVAAGLASGTATAAPLINVYILASTSQNGTYTNSLTVIPGEKVYFEVTGEMAPIGTTDTTANKTITSLTPAPTSATQYDGMNSMSYTLSDAGGFQGNFTGSTVTSEWSQQSSATGGTGTNSPTLSGVRAINAVGVYDGAVAPTVFSTGNFTVASNGVTAGQISTISGAFGAVSSTFNINSNPSTGVPGYHGTISGADGNHFSGYAPLTLSDGLVWNAGSSNTWDSSTPNFTGAAYADPDSVSFADSDGNGNTLPASAGNVTLSSTVNPSVVNFDNTKLTYSLGGAGGIGSTGSVYINGGGTVILKNANTYNGGTYINAGKLQAATGSLPSTGALTIGAAGTLAVGDGVSTTPSNLTTGNQTWTGGGSYQPKVDAVDSGADLLNIGSGTGSLTIYATGASGATPFTISPQVVNGSLGQNSESWELAAFSSTLLGYSGTLPSVIGGNVTVDSQFALSTAGLGAPSADFTLSINELSTGHDALFLNYAAAPEPSTFILLLVGAVPMLLKRKRNSSMTEENQVLTSPPRR